MSAKPAEEAAPAEKPKSKKMLIIIVAVVLVLVIAGGGAAFFLMKKKPAEGEGAEGEAPAEKPKPAAVAKPKLDPKAPPVYLPMENLVVNLADPGGGRFAQLGITLQLDDPKTADLVKLHMPSVRNSVLMAASKRTADEMLAPAGKEKLARSITNLVSATLGYDVDDEDEEEEPPNAKKKKKRAPPALPVLAVLFTSFIVQ